MEDFPHQLRGRDGQILVLSLPKALNHLSAEPVKAAVRRLLPNRDDAALVLDCREVAIITSIGIATLLQVQEQCGDARAPMVLAGVTPPIRKMLAMLRLDNKFRIEADLDDAVAGLDAAA